MLQARAAVRRTFRGLRTVKGAALGLVGAVVFLSWLMPMGMAAAQAPPVDPQAVRDFAPLALLALTVASAVSAGEKAISFTPAEVNFLFVGPFTRRQLLAYKLSKSVAGAVALALLLSLATRRFSTFWPAAFTGAALALVMATLCTTVVGVLRQSVVLRADTPARQAAGAAIPIAFVVASALALAKSDWLLASASQIVHAPAARVVLAPFQPFVRAYAAGGFIELLPWAGAALAIDLALFAAIMRLDTNYLEAAAAAGEKVYDQQQRFRRGDWMPGLKVAGSRSRVPPFPWLGGAGPIAWRQLVTLLRRAPKLAFMLLLALCTMAPILFLGRRLPNVQAVLFPALGWTTIMLLAALRFDFRGDLDQLPWLKSLPLRPLPMAAGQLVVPVAVLTLFHVAVFTAVAMTLEPLRRPAIAGIFLALPVDLLLVGIENLTFLLFPSRPTAPAELGALGRQMTLFFLKMVMVVAASVVAGLVGGIAYVLTRSIPAAVAAAGVAVSVIALGLIPLVAGAYRRFDPGADLPP